MAFIGFEWVLWDLMAIEQGFKFIFMAFHDDLNVFFQAILSDLVEIYGGYEQEEGIKKSWSLCQQIDHIPNSWRYVRYMVTMHPVRLVRGWYAQPKCRLTEQTAMGCLGATTCLSDNCIALHPHLLLSSIQY